jgi:hypothetical protein
MLFHAMDIQQHQRHSVHACKYRIYTTQEEPVQETLGQSVGASKRLMRFRHRSEYFHKLTIILPQPQLNKGKEVVCNMSTRILSEASEEHEAKP